MTISWQDYRNNPAYEVVSKECLEPKVESTVRRICHQGAPAYALRKLEDGGK